MAPVVLNIGYCNEHFKGGDGINQMRGEEHARWLLEAVRLYAMQTPECWPIYVSITGFRGWPSVEISAANPERDVLWKVFHHPRVRFVTMDNNPGHQVGAAWCIRLGLEAAGKGDYSYMIHTAEDVVPHAGALDGIAFQLAAGAEYVGEVWGEGKDELNSQFFGCRTGHLGALFDPPQVRAHGHVERYLRKLLRDDQVCFIERLYRTTHDFGQWCRWARESQSE